ncbi:MULTISPECIES: DUF5666 domain-containing protein [Halomonadaceae]|uniref:DUF5666 domain-containing protein n=1 Tax=Vreelandella halophila TaxID=86177 RepID=A0A9X5B510_9GAMM|nr:MULTISPECIES: DUF5666 domain-containing protein [Halomonas]MYL25948.1 hypothetical protein [Halomonas utahensis]MYL73490.1 hypothetical protein [Halomonas sp. 22501_18_FS]
MKRNRLSLAVYAAVFGSVLGVGGCFGGGSGGGNVADGGIRGTGASVGPVARFGSVFVNGTRFDTSSLNGRVESDDGIDREDDLEKGMILRVEGEWRNNGRGTAERLEYDDTLRGNVQNVTVVDATAGTAELTILDQTVQVDGQTVLRDISFASIEDLADQFVRVSGWRLADGSFRASFVGTHSGGSDDDVEIEGRIDAGSLDTGARTFAINGLITEWTSTTEFDDLTESDLAEDLGVEVEGRFQGDRLVATEIEREDSARYSRGDDDDLEIVGPVTVPWESNDRTFSVNGIEFDVDDDTEFDDGLQPTDLVAGRLVKVEAEFDDGRWVAEEVEQREANAEVDGTLTATPDRDNEILRVGGVEVRVTASTVISDDDDDDGRRLGFDDLSEGFSYEVEGIDRGSDGYLEAVKIERDDDDGEGFNLEGVITDLDPSSGENRLIVLGLSIQTNVSTGFDNTSFENLTIGDRVEVEYQKSGGDYIAEEVELEDDDD